MVNALLGDRTRDKDDIVEEMREAIEIIETVDPPADLRVPMFNVVVQAITQRLRINAGNGLHIG